MSQPRLRSLFWRSWLWQELWCTLRPEFLATVSGARLCSALVSSSVLRLEPYCPIALAEERLFGDSPLRLHSSAFDLSFLNFTDRRFDSGPNDEIICSPGIQIKTRRSHAASSRSRA